jgi:hypothetical protein
LPYNQISDGEIGWLAGVLDGEASFSIIVHTGKHPPNFTPKITVGNTSRELVEKCRKLIHALKGNPGKLVIYDRHKKLYGYKRQFRFSLCSMDNGYTPQEIEIVKKLRDLNSHSHPLTNILAEVRRHPV